MRVTLVFTGIIALRRSEVLQSDAMESLMKTSSELIFSHRCNSPTYNELTLLSTFLCLSACVFFSDVMNERVFVLFTATRLAHMNGVKSYTMLQV